MACATNKLIGSTRSVDFRLGPFEGAGIKEDGYGFHFQPHNELLRWG